ncbi:MAG: Maf family protein [Leptonema sp. (in: bacteria)]
MSENRIQDSNEMIFKNSEYWNKHFQERSTEIFLASQSSRRKWILESWGLKFHTIEPQFNEDSFLENLTSINKKDIYWEVKTTQHKDLIHEICSNLAIQKALLAWEILKQEQKNFIVISADTFVYYNQYFFTKPTTEEEAFQMLSFLSGKTHTVLTSHCILNKEKKIITKEVMSLVTFRKLSPLEIKTYLSKNQFTDKAGGYGIQEEGAILIDSIVGDYLNIIGFSLSAIRFLLSEMDT